jgi:hypothetical protein
MAAAVLAGCRPASFGGRARVDRAGRLAGRRSPGASRPFIAIDAPSIDVAHGVHGRNRDEGIALPRDDRKGPDARLPIIAAAPELRMRGRFIGSGSARSRDGNGRRLL